jgi:hypothetical protein
MSIHPATWKFLFRGLGGLLWRYNPIAPFTEACIIICYFVQAVGRCVREGPWLYRAVHAEPGYGRVFGKPQKGCYFYVEIPRTRQVVLEQNLCHYSQGMQQPDKDKRWLNPWSCQGTFIVYRTPHNLGLVCRAQDSPVVKPPNLEANAPLSWSETNLDSSPARTSEQTRIFKAALGTNGLAHREWRIDSLTTVSAFLIIVKVSAAQDIPSSA